MHPNTSLNTLNLQTQVSCMKSMKTGEKEEFLQTHTLNTFPNAGEPPVCFHCGEDILSYESILKIILKKE